MTGYILAIDQSTAGTKALLFDAQGGLCAREDLPHRQLVDENGWVSHDPLEIYGNLLGAVRALFGRSGVDPAAVVGAAISNQRETALVWDRQTGEPLCDAVVWQCGRAADICGRLERAGHGEEIRAASGLRLSPYFSAGKIAWILEHTQAEKNTLYAGTMDSWLLYKLTGRFLTDVTNASRTQLMNLSSLQWDENVCGIFSISPSMLAEIHPSDALFGESDFEGILPRPVPIHAVMGDSHGALLGQGCLQKGMAKATYGTGSSVMMNLGHAPAAPAGGLSATVGYSLGGNTCYALEGNIHYSGAVIRWLRDELGLLDASEEAGPLAAQARAEDATYLVPAFSGLGAPWWAPDARAVLCGMDRGTGRAEIVRAAEECIAYQIADVIGEMKKHTGISIPFLRADGGANRDAFLMQFQSDILGLPLRAAETQELSGAGTAYAAGIALGLYPETVLTGGAYREYLPKMSGGQKNRKLDGWKNAVKTVLSNVEDGKSR